MRRRLLSALTIAAVLVSCGATVSAKASPAAIGCKALRGAVNGTPAGAHFIRFVAAGPSSCVSDSGGDEPWRVLLDLGLGSKHAQAACKVLRAQHGIHFGWMIRAHSGADLACQGTSVGNDRFSDTIYFDKGRWSGIFGLEGPARGVTGSIPLMLRKITAQLR